MFSFCEWALDLRWFAAHVHTFSTDHSSICLVTFWLAQLETVKTRQDSLVTQKGGRDTLWNQLGHFVQTSSFLYIMPAGRR